MKNNVLVDEQIYKNNVLPKISVTEIYDDELLQMRDSNKTENVH